MRWLIFLVLFPHFKPSGIDYISHFLGSLFSALRLISALLIIILHFAKRKIPSKPIWTLSLFELVIIFSTYINGGNVFSTAILAASVLSVSVACDLFSAYPMSLLRGVLLNLEWIIYANLLSIIITNRKGFDPNLQGSFFLTGNRNGFCMYGFLAVFVSLVYANKIKNSIRAYCLIVATYACIILTWPATTVFAFLIITIFLFVPYRMKKLITYRNVLLSTVTVDLLISVFRITDRVGWIVWTIESVLHRNLTFTGRTSLWDQFYEAFAKHPILGYGSGERFTIYGQFYHAHNQYFEILSEGGIIALVLFIIFHLQVGKKLTKSKGHYIVDVMLAVLTGLYIEFITESILSPIVFLLLMLAYHIEKLDLIRVQNVPRSFVISKKPSKQ